jgi:phage replication initiation protein
VSRGTRVEAAAVLSGQHIKWTLEQLERETQQKVRIDWLRFTMPLDAVVRREILPCPVMAELASMSKHEREQQLMCRIADASLDYCGAQVIAAAAAKQVAELLGVFEVGQPEDKGMDYYTARCALMHEGKVVGHALAGSKSPHQVGTVHVNLHGEACLYVSPAKWKVLREWIAADSGWLTRVDLACDVWSGDRIEDVPRAYLAGSFDGRGQRPKESQAGSWVSGHSRTFYVGKRETGKLFRAYEKGDQLFGEEAADPWLRYEVELRNNARILDLDVLTRPADFFAGAYEFTAALLDRLDAHAVAQVIPAGQKLRDATAEAAVFRFTRGFVRAGAPAFCWLLSHGGDILDFIVQSEAHRVPGRLRGFSVNALSEAFGKVAAGFAPPGAPSINGA